MSAPDFAGLAAIAPARLEYWLRDRYFDARTDISSSGVENYTLGDLRELAGVDLADLAALPFRDSPSTGAAPLREAIARHIGVPDPERVAVGHGSSESMFLALSALIRPGDEVVTVRPAYQSLWSIAEALGARLVEWPLDGDADFAPDLDRLAGLLTERTRAVVVNFPHNPTGVTLDETGFQRLLDLVDRHGCHLFWDGASTMLTYEAPPLPDPTTLIERCVSFGTLSKAYGLPGLRLGWTVAPPALIDDMVRLRDYLTLSTSPLSEAIATAVLENADAVLAPQLRRARLGREVLAAWLADNADLFACALPAGGVVALPRVRGVADVEPHCEALLAEHGVLVVPGSCFDHPDRMRIGFGCDTAVLERGLGVLAHTFRDVVTGSGAHPERGTS
ncbi:capreomycidine synthase [Streptomyces sp. NPDC088135]|uniref:capreomycidine synthase n=1 Tax=Streptomyces sp. NPDC088135 TaxID=3160993 RepID=UPI00342E0A46